MGGYRSRRRRGGGGGHGGHGGGGQAFAWTGEANGLQPGDDIGNRKSFKPVLVPPDDIGNRREADEEDEIPYDDVGNRVEANPTHEVSGVLLELDPKKRKRRAKSSQQPQERIGRYIVGGVNPLISGGMRPPPPPPDDGFLGGDEPEAEVRPFVRPERKPQGTPRPTEVSARRAQRFFDFDEDDRFDYTLKSQPEEKRTAALAFVNDVMREAGREGVVDAVIIDDADKPKLLVTIAEGDDPLFVLGNAALMSLNYLANKVINRFPDDRIRLAVLPKADEVAYRESLEEHRKHRAGVPTAAPAEPVVPVVAEAAAVVTVEPSTEALPKEEAEAPRGRARRGRGRARDTDVAVVDVPVVEAPVVEAPVVEAPVVETPVVEAAVEVEPQFTRVERAPRGRRKASSSKAEELVPPPSAYVPEPEPEPEQQPEQKRQSGWRAAPLPDEEAVTPARLGGARSRPRRGGPSLVEVVRVTKK